MNSGNKDTILFSFLFVFQVVLQQLFNGIDQFSSADSKFIRFHNVMYFSCDVELRTLLHKDNGVLRSIKKGRDKQHESSQKPEKTSAKYKCTFNLFRR